MEHQQFEWLLTSNPFDWDLRRIFADWLEEQGDAIAAAGQRWQANNQKCPTPQASQWYWHNSMTRKLPEEARLPWRIFEQIDISNSYAARERDYAYASTHLLYNSLDEAEAALALAWSGINSI